MPRTFRIAAAAALAAVLFTGCRSTGLWSGARFAADGSLQVIADEPVCGCLTLTNRSAQPVILRSALGGSTLGAAVLNGNESRRFRFDWVGQRNDDLYIIDGMDGSGRDLSLREVTRMEARPVDCDSAMCIYDTLLMNVGTTDDEY